MIATLLAARALGPRVVEGPEPMACDIHIAVEAFGGGEWHLLSAYEYEEIGDGRSRLYIEKPRLLGHRNYTVFGALAGVRDTSVPMIDSPRGLPKDLSPLVAEWAKQWEGDAHTHGWLTLDEIREYPWDRLVEGQDVRHDFNMLLQVWCAALLDEHGPQVRIVFFFDN